MAHSVTKIVSRFKDSSVDRQMREVVRAANQLFTDIDTHSGKRDNPHQVTVAQIGAETPAGAQAKVDTLETDLDARIDVLEAAIPIGDYKLSKNVTTGNLEIFKGTTKLADIDASGNMRISGTLSESQVF
jgi:hypothetical protein